MDATAETDGRLLRLWLELLGWQIETSRDGEFVVGVASHVAANGTSIRLGGCARNQGELVLELFEGAMRNFESARRTLGHQLSAA